jgi:hypothetical protein
MWLNGVQVDTGAVAFTAVTHTSLIVGAGAAYTSNFKGWIKSIKFFNGTIAADLLTAQEANDGYCNSTFTFMNKAICMLLMDNNGIDLVNNVVRDISPKGYHLSLGNGSTASTFPTKITSSIGYTYDGGDYLSTTKQISSGTYSISAYIKPTHTFGATRYYFDSGGTGTILHSGTTGVITPSAGTVYVNGKQASYVYRNQLGFVSVVGIAVASTGTVRVGTYRTLAANSTFQGDIYYFSIFPFTMSPTQIIEEYAFVRSIFYKN